jgi:hypothetical protein
MGICHLRLLERDFDAARKIYLENRPKYRDFIFSDQIAAQVEFFARNYPQALSLYSELDKKDNDGGATFLGTVSYKSALGRLMQLLGQEEEGQTLLENCLAKQLAELKDRPNDGMILYQISAIQSSLGHVDSAFVYLQEAVNSGGIDYRSMSLDPRFDSISGDPRFKKIIEATQARVEELRRSALRLTSAN